MDVETPSGILSVVCPGTGTSYETEPVLFVLKQNMEEVRSTDKTTCGSSSRKTLLCMCLENERKGLYLFVCLVDILQAPGSDDVCVF